MPSSAANLHPSQKKVDKIKSQEDAEKEEVAGKKNTLRKNHIHPPCNYLPLTLKLL